jgi:sugar/nucleoside kinase (ribokinase family)
MPVPRDFQLCGIGNAIVDFLLEVHEEEFATLGFERGTMRLVDKTEQEQLIDKFRDHDPRLASGGSVANSLIAFSQLGGKAAFIGCVGDDRYGLFYQGEFEQLGIEIGNPAIIGETTATCVSIITPDAERTMRTCLAVSGHLSNRHVDASRIQASDWLFVEGYVLANPSTGQGAVREAVRIAREAGTMIALTCSDAFIVEVFGDAFFEVLQQSALLFCNATEAMAVTQTKNPTEAFAKLQEMVPSAVVTDGPHGAFVRHGGQEYHVPAFACTPKDVTGAGDMFAGAFLYGITHGFAPDIAARAANYLAMKVITQYGARLHHGTRNYWDQTVMGN